MYGFFAFVAGGSMAAAAALSMRAEQISNHSLDMLAMASAACGVLAVIGMYLHMPDAPDPEGKPRDLKPTPEPKSAECVPSWRADGDL